MGMKITSDFESLMTIIRQGGERVVRGVSTQMKKEGEEIQKLAREYAPVDEGNLEDAITVEADRSGVRGRTVVYVYVDENHPAHMTTVGQYAMRMHEGEYRLGPGSQAKDAGRGVVGPKFLERAVDERSPMIMPSLLESARKVLS